MDPRIRKLAEILIGYSCTIEKGDWLYLTVNSVSGKPLYDAVRTLALKKGAHVSDHFCYDPHQTPTMLDYMFLKYASDQQLKEFPKFRLIEMEQMQAYIRIEAGENPIESSSIDPKNIALRSKTIRPILEERLKKKWVVTLFPTMGLAQAAGMSLEEFEDFVFKAVFADKKDPIAEWKRVSEYQQRLVTIINTARTVRILGKETDLTFSIEGRTAVNCDGHFNMPDGEVFTGPVENSAQGKIFFGTIPTIYAGKEVEGVRLEFEDGKVVNASAEKNNEFLRAALDMDEGARYLGEFGIGANFGIQRPVKEILFDEKIGGTIHLALGSGYPETGSKNKSALHWDMIMDLREEGEVFADDRRLIIRKDRIVLE